MFLIRIIEKNKSKKLTQWDADRYIEITAPEGVEVSHVDFAYENDPKAIRREIVLSDGIMTAKVPNSLLQRCGKMRVWLVCEDVTVFGDILVVAQKARDEGYVLPDDEDDVYNYTNLEKRIADIEKNGTGGGIAKETDPTVPAWAKQPTKPTYTAEEVGALSKGTKIPNKLSDLENDLELEVEGTVEITDGEPTKESTVMTLNPNAEEVNLYTAEEIDEMLQNLPSGGSGGSEYPKKVFEYEWKDNYDKINVTAIDYENGILTVDSMPSQITEELSTTVRVFPMLLIEGITESFQYGFIPEELLNTSESYYAVKVGDSQIKLYNGNNVLNLTDSGNINLTRWKFQVETQRNNGIVSASVGNIEPTHRYKALFYLPYSAHVTAALKLTGEKNGQIGSAYLKGYASQGIQLTKENAVFSFVNNQYESLSMRGIYYGNKNHYKHYPKIYEVDIKKIGNVYKASATVNYFYELGTLKNTSIIPMQKAETDIYLQKSCTGFIFTIGNSNFILDGSRCEVWDYGEVF